VARCFLLGTSLVPEEHPKSSRLGPALGAPACGAEMMSLRLLSERCARAARSLGIYTPPWHCAP
jgi:hypothetical protein